MIYILEDDASIRKLVVYTIQSQGMEAEGFERPSQFWEALERRTPDLLLLDIMLPEEDGLQVLKRLRSLPASRSLPVILLTAKSTEYDKVLGLDEGADDYVAKPFGMMELMGPDPCRPAPRRAAGATEPHLLPGHFVCGPRPAHRSGRGAGGYPDAEGVSGPVSADGAGRDRVYPGSAAQHHLGL